MHFLIRETLSFNLIYVAACYLVGTGMCHNMVGLLQHYTGYLGMGFCDKYKNLMSCPMNYIFYSSSGDCCHLLIAFANSLDPDEDRQKVCPDRIINLIVFLKEFFEKWQQTTTKAKLPSMQRVNFSFA